MTKFYEVANLYLGCKIADNDGITTDMNAHYFLYGNFSKIHSGELKPVLRRLSSMTEEEALEFVNIGLIPAHKFEKISVTILNENVIYFTDHNTTGFNTEHDRCFDKLDSLQFSWLLSKHFDLFGLLDNNEAIESPSLSIGGEEKTK